MFEEAIEQTKKEILQQIDEGKGIDESRMTLVQGLITLQRIHKQEIVDKIILSGLVILIIIAVIFFVLGFINTFIM